MTSKFYFLNLQNKMLKLCTVVELKYLNSNQLKRFISHH